MSTLLIEIEHRLVRDELSHKDNDTDYHCKRMRQDSGPTDGRTTHDHCQLGGRSIMRCVHKLSNLQKRGFEKIAIEVVDTQTAKIQLNSGLAKYILYGSAVSA